MDPINALEIIDQHAIHLPARTQEDRDFDAWSDSVIKYEAHQKATAEVRPESEWGADHTGGREFADLLGESLKRVHQMRGPDQHLAKREPIASATEPVAGLGERLMNYFAGRSR